MSGYLENYGAGDDKRERRLRKAALAVLIVAVGGVVAYFQFRNYREDRQFTLFLDLLSRKEYKEAYVLWGCSDAKPCRDYAFDKFLEDWGPQSRHANVSQAKVTRTRSCSTGVIKTLHFPDDEVLMWVERKDGTIGFAPWPICNPRLATP